MALPETLLEGKYEILDKIRDGGMGSIYRVRHRLLDEIRVIKVMKPHVVADPDLRRRFLEEAKTITRLKHANICAIYDFALDDAGVAYLVMEFIEGVNLSELMISRGTPSLPLTLEMAHQTLLALGYLHRKGVVHRDVAPDNLMLTHNEEGRPTIKLIDLGIAKVADPSIDATATGVFLGKLKYASPEQFGSLPRGNALDGRSDLYSVGIVLYELLTGSLPFTGETPADLLRAHLFNPATPFSVTDPEGKVPEDVRAVVLMALEKKREDRYPSAEEFARVIHLLKQHHTRAEDFEETRAIVRSIRPSRDVLHEGVTPSAQSRMDRQFGAARTPTPSKPFSTAASVPDADTLMAPSAGVLRPGKAPPARRRFPLAEVLIATAALVGILLVVWNPRKSERGPRIAAATPAPASAAAPPAVLPTIAATSPSEPSPEPAPEPTAEPTPPAARPTARPTTREPIRIVAVPTRPAPPSPTRIFATPFPQAPAPAEPPAQVAVAQAPTVALPAARPSAAPRPASTDQDRIRETVQAYERAQNTLDADLYARVFPAVDRSRIARAFESFRSQSVEFEIKRIEVEPGATQAAVYGYEKRVAVPRAGTEQRIDADRVLRLQKRGDTWVITAIQ